MQIRLDTLRCSGCNKTFQAVAAEGNRAKCPHCPMRYQFKRGEWHATK